MLLHRLLVQHSWVLILTNTISFSFTKPSMNSKPRNLSRLRPFVLRSATFHAVCTYLISSSPFAIFSWSHNILPFIWRSLPTPHFNESIRTSLLSVYNCKRSQLLCQKFNNMLQIKSITCRRWCRKPFSFSWTQWYALLTSTGAVNNDTIEHMHCAASRFQITSTTPVWITECFQNICHDLSSMTPICDSMNVQPLHVLFIFKPNWSLKRR